MISSATKRWSPLRPVTSRRIAPRLRSGGSPDADLLACRLRHAFRSNDLGRAQGAPIGSPCWGRVGKKPALDLARTPTLAPPERACQTRCCKIRCLHDDCSVYPLWTARNMKNQNIPTLRLAL